MPSSKHAAPTRPYAGVSASDRIAARRNRLVDAATELFGTRGYAGTGVKDICREAGLTDRYFYESFPGKQELFLAAFDRTTGQLLELVAAAVSAAPARPEAQVRAAIEAFVRALADDQRWGRVIFSESAGAGLEAERHMRATLRTFAELVAATARPYLPAGMPEPLVRMGALSLVGAIDRVIGEWQEGELDVSIDDIIEYLVGLFLTAGASVGVTAPPRFRASG